MRNKKLIVLLIAAIFIFSVIVVPRVVSAKQDSAFDDEQVLPARGEQWINFTINFYKKELPRYLPKGIKFEVVRSTDGKGVAIHMITPKNYTAKDMMYLDSLQSKINDKLNSAWREESKKIIEQRQNSISPNHTENVFRNHTYHHLSGTEYHYYYYQTVLGTSIDTDVNWYGYTGHDKATMQGTSSVWITEPMQSYQRLKLEIKLHLWGVSISYGLPPSGFITEATESYHDTCNAPNTSDILNFPIWTRYGLALHRAGQDQNGYITYSYGGTQTTDSVHIYRGCELDDN